MTAPFRMALLLATLALPRPALAQDTTPRGYAVQSHTPEGFKLPDRNGCSGEIARWQAVQANDYAGGNVSLKVYSLSPRGCAGVDGQGGFDSTSDR